MVNAQFWAMLRSSPLAGNILLENPSIALGFGHNHEVFILNIVAVYATHTLSPTAFYPISSWNLEFDEYITLATIRFGQAQRECFINSTRRILDLFQQNQKHFQNYSSLMHP